MTNPWPVSRSRRSSIIAQFGSDRADLLQWALTTGDPLADAVVIAMHADPEVRGQLGQGLLQGLDAISGPHEAVRALLTETERRPDYIDGDFLETGSRPFHSMPPAVHIVSLSVGALVRVYESPSIATVLAGTGRLIEGAERRIRETAKWLGTAMLPGALGVGGPGYVATIRVRLLHAMMRRGARHKGFDEAALGVPINQVDLGRTWMDFTLTAWSAEEAMGFGLTSGELDRLYRLWWYVGHLMGVDARLIEGISAHEQARRVDDLFQAVTGPPIAESPALVAATLDSIKNELNAAFNVPATLGLRALWSLTRRFHGDRVADELGIPASPVSDPVISGAIEICRHRRSAARRDPEQWEADIDRNIAALKSELAALDGAQYES